MTNIYSYSDEYIDLCSHLKERLKKELYIYDLSSEPFIFGKYYGLTDNTNTSDYVTIKNGLPFHIKFGKDSFLRVGVGRTLSREVTEGEKLSALSDLCVALSEKYGTPDVFYTTKTDEAESLALQWTFKNLEAEHKEMEDDVYFEDDSIDKLIFIDNKKPVVYDDFSKFVGLPREMYGLVLENLDDFQAANHGYIREKGKGYVKKID